MPYSYATLPIENRCVAHVRSHAHASSLARCSWCNPSYSAVRLSTCEQPGVRAKDDHAVSQSLQQAPHADAIECSDSNFHHVCLLFLHVLLPPLLVFHVLIMTVLCSSSAGCCSSASNCPCSFIVGGGTACAGVFLLLHSRPFFPKHFSC